MTKHCTGMPVPSNLHSYSAYVSIWKGEGSNSCDSCLTLTILSHEEKCGLAKSLCVGKITSVYVLIYICFQNFMLHNKFENNPWLQDKWGFDSWKFKLQSLPIIINAWSWLKNGFFSLNITSLFSLRNI